MAFSAFATSTKERRDNYEASRHEEERTRVLKGQSTGLKSRPSQNKKGSSSTGNYMTSTMTPMQSHTPAYDGPSVNLSMLDARQYT